MRSRIFAVIALFLLVCAPILFHALQLFSVNVPVNTPWVRASGSTIVALPLAALVLSLIGVFYDRSKWLAWAVLVTSCLASIFLIVSGLSVLL